MLMDLSMCVRMLSPPPFQLFDACMTHSLPLALVQQQLGLLLAPDTIFKNHTDSRKQKTLKGTSQEEGGSPDTNLGPNAYCLSSSTTWAHPVALFVNDTSVTAMYTRTTTG